jgi:acyl-CoA synthetase (NDP forming)
MGTLTGDAAERFANTLELTASESGIPLQFVWLANREETQGGRGLFRSRGFPVLDSLTNSAITARLLFEVGESRRRHRLEDPVPAVPTADVLASLLPHHVSLEYEAADFFDVLEILHPKGILVANADEARLACRVLDGPFVLKLQARDVLHKTERGAVRIDVSENDVPNRVLELLEMPNIESEGVLIQEMVTSAGVELIVGVQKSLANFPAMITVGLGGIFAELYRDVATHVAPVGVPTALDMLNSLRASRLLNGYRGNSQFDSLAAANVIARISAVGAALGELLEEIEINPLIVLSEGEGAIALDFHARIRSSGRTESE